mgnify:CR=1 FL=1
MQRAPTGSAPEVDSRRTGVVASSEKMNASAVASVVSRTNRVSAVVQTARSAELSVEECDSAVSIPAGLLPQARTARVAPTVASPRPSSPSRLPPRCRPRRPWLRHPPAHTTPRPRRRNLAPSPRSSAWASRVQRALRARHLGRRPPSPSSARSHRSRRSPRRRRHRHRHRHPRRPLRRLPRRTWSATRSPT